MCETQSRGRDGAACLSPKWQVRKVASSDSPISRPNKFKIEDLKFQVGDDGHSF
jgi:hypothetical protein